MAHPDSRTAEERINNIKEVFIKKYPSNKILRFFLAPGRVNLIGDHTDYNGGFALPICIEQNTLMAAQPNDAGLFRVHSVNFDQTVECPLTDAEIKYQKEPRWANYPLGIAWVLKKHGYNVEGCDIIFDSNIPASSGLASSAALEVATCLALDALGNLKIERARMASLCQEAENSFVRVHCGIMDQFTIVNAKKGHALFLDCRHLKYENIPFNIPDLTLVIADSKKKRELNQTQYNSRRAECTEAVNILINYLGYIRGLRDVSIEQFEVLKYHMTEKIQKRCTHVIYENVRVLQAQEFLKKKRFKEFGKVLNESHNSLKRLFEVSCPELDLLVETAWQFDGVIGARMTGAGFGGSILALVQNDRLKEFEKTIAEKYEKQYGVKPDFYTSGAETGARELGT